MLWIILKIFLYLSYFSGEFNPLSTQNIPKILIACLHNNLINDIVICHFAKITFSYCELNYPDQKIQ